MIQQNLSLQPDTHGWWFIFSGNQVLQIGETESLPKHFWHQLEFAHAYQDQVVKIGEYQDLPCMLLDLGAEVPDTSSAELVGLRQFMFNNDDALFELISRAWQIALFLRTHRFCGQCGSRMQNVGWKMAMQCHTCQHRTYPRISPCIIVAIRKSKQILLAQGKNHKDGMYSTLAGFVESGESLEQAVHREVMEEVGVKVKNLQYFGTQPWPFPHQLMCGFLADYDSDEINIDENEILAADWFDFDNLPFIPPPFSIAGQLIEATLKNIQADHND